MWKWKYVLTPHMMELTRGRQILRLQRFALVQDMSPHLFYIEKTAEWRAYGTNRLRKGYGISSWRRRRVTLMPVVGLSTMSVEIRPTTSRTTFHWLPQATGVSYESTHL